MRNELLEKYCDSVFASRFLSSGERHPRASPNQLRAAGQRECHGSFELPCGGNCGSFSYSAAHRRRRLSSNRRGGEGGACSGAGVVRREPGHETDPGSQDPKCGGDDTRGGGGGQERASRHCLHAAGSRADGNGAQTPGGTDGLEGDHAAAA